MRLVNKRSSQWSWTWVGKLTCCLRSKHVRMSLNLLVIPFELSRCKLKSPSIYKLSWSGIMFSSKSWNSSKNRPVPFLSLYRQTTKPLNELFPIRAEIASNVLKVYRGWISVLNWLETKMPTPPPVHWSAGGEISAIVDCVSSCFNHVSVTATMSRFFDVTYSEKGPIFGLIDRTFIIAIHCCHLSRKDPDLNWHLQPVEVRSPI